MGFHPPTLARRGLPTRRAESKDDGLDAEGRAAAQRALELARESTGKMFGFTSGPPSAEAARELGLDPASTLLVAGVNAGSMAELAGLQAHDVITSVAGRPATTSALRSVKDEHEFFATVPFAVLRDGHTLRIDVPIGAGPAN